jgi:hypothetical protein
MCTSLVWFSDYIIVVEDVLFDVLVILYPCVGNRL